MEDTEHGREENQQRIISEVIGAEDNFYLRLGLGHLQQSHFSQYQEEVQTIRNAYLVRSRLIHPDKCKLPRTTEAFQRLANAYEVLRDPNRRRDYELRHSTPMESFFTSASSPPIFQFNDFADAQAIFNEVFEQFRREMNAGNFSKFEFLDNPALYAETVRELMENTRATFQEIQEIREDVKSDFLKLEQLQERFKKVKFYYVLELAILALAYSITTTEIVQKVDKQFLKNYNPFPLKVARFSVELFHKGLVVTESSLVWAQNEVNNLAKWGSKFVAKFVPKFF